MVDDLTSKEGQAKFLENNMTVSVGVYVIPFSLPKMSDWNPVLFIHKYFPYILRFALHAKQASGRLLVVLLCETKPNIWIILLYVGIISMK